MSRTFWNNKIRASSLDTIHFHFMLLEPEDRLMSLSGRVLSFFGWLPYLVFPSGRVAQSLRGLEGWLRKTVAQESTSFLWNWVNWAKPLRTFQLPPSPLSLYHTLSCGLEGYHLQGHCHIELFFLMMWVMTDSLSRNRDLCLKPILSTACPGSQQVWSPGVCCSLVHAGSLSFWDLGKRQVSDNLFAS